MGRMTKKKKTEGGILHFCLMFLPCVNKGDDNDDDDDDDDDDEGAGGGEGRNSRNSVYSHIYTKP